MKVHVDDELRQMSRRIFAEGLAEQQWAARESDDMFQSPTYAGGFDATEKAFCFSYFPPDGSEFWFQLTLDQVREIAEGKLIEVSARPAE